MNGNLSIKRWSAWRAGLGLGIRPAETARRTNHVPLWQAFGVFVVGSFVWLCCVLFLLFWMEHDRVSVWACFDWVLRNLSEMVEHPVLSIPMALGWIGLFVFIAMIMSLWGARNEPMRASIRASLRRTWFHSLQLIPLTIVAVCLVMWSTHILLRAYDEIPPTPPAMPLVDGKRPAPDSDAMKKYRIEREAYLVKKDAFSAKYCFYSGCSSICDRQISFLRGFWWIAAGVLWLLGLRRAVAQERSVSEELRQGEGDAVPSAHPVCFACGYDLYGLQEKGVCPECSEPFDLNDRFNQGIGSCCEFAGGLSWIVWWKTGRVAIRHPQEMARQLSKVQPGECESRFLWKNLLLMSVLIAAGAFMLTRMTPTLRGSSWEDVFNDSLLIGLASVGGGILLFSFLGFASGVYVWKRTGRNPLLVIRQWIGPLGYYLIRGIVISYGVVFCMPLLFRVGRLVPGVKSAMRIVLFPIIDFISNLFGLSDSEAIRLLPALVFCWFVFGAFRRLVRGGSCG